MRQAIKPSLDERVRRSASDVLARRTTRGRVRRIWPFLGPAFIAAVAYVDPGNFATNIQGGAEFGYLLLWVVLWANLMAMLVQALSAKLGIATGKNLAEVIRDRYPRWLVWPYWIQAEAIAIATDIAELLGGAIGFHLLFGTSIFVGALLTGLCSLAILNIQHYGFRAHEGVIGVLIGAVAVAYVIEVALSGPQPGPLLDGLLVPGFAGERSVYLAAGILGATVMPHVVYLHSALLQGRIATTDAAAKRRLYRLNLVDVAMAMGIAGLVNMAMLIMAAATFHATGHPDVADLTTAYRTLGPLLGGLAGVTFAVALLASGISSSVVGTMAGQVVMQGFVGFSIPIWARRLITMVPALVVVLIATDPTEILVLSQVILSFGIPFALVPLIQFTQGRPVMGGLVNARATTCAGWAIAAVVIALNFFLLWQLAGAR